MQKKDTPESVLHQLIDILNGSDLNNGEIFECLAGLIYSVGASWLHKELGPEEVMKEYYSNPSLGVALQAQAYLMTEWKKNDERRKDKGASGKTAESEASQS